MKNNKTISQQMKCPKCGEIANFFHIYRVQYVAPVVLKDGDITINHDRETPQDMGDDEDTCQCRTCGSEVQIVDIEIVGAEEAEA